MVKKLAALLLWVIGTGVLVAVALNKAAPWLRHVTIAYMLEYALVKAKKASKKDRDRILKLMLRLTPEEVQCLQVDDVTASKTDGKGNQMWTEKEIRRHIEDILEKTY